ncbi:MAG: RNA polymerase sigma factor [Candidatus Solibacter usitatus]|nr:RNA polymerase sigma factor [Candidatus Solibacter usitatus]
MSAEENPDDAGLLGRMRKGDADAFTTLYRRHQGPVYRFALQMTGSRAVAEDVTQEVFMALIRNPESYDAARGPLASYLYGVARNTVHRSLERDRFCAPESEEESAAPDNALADLTRQETLVEVRRAILALPANYREVVVLCDLHEMSYEDAAEVMGCAVGTVRSRLNRARNLLAAKLTRTGANPARCLA